MNENVMKLRAKQYCIEKTSTQEAPGYRGRQHASPEHNSVQRVFNTDQRKWKLHKGHLWSVYPSATS